MKGELEMEFVDVVDVKQGLAMYRLKKKITFENKFFSSSVSFFKLLFNILVKIKIPITNINIKGKINFFIFYSFQIKLLKIY